ncbi:MAG TPA: M48 family metalloprotease [Vicinamibacterales bacterium]|nr:M48 family metalloprotease [Vicinamibacterales bacterium]
MNEDRAARYHRLKRQASVVSLIWSVLVLGSLLLTGWSAALRDVARTWAGNAPAPLQDVFVVLIFVVFLSLLHEAAGFPLVFYSGFLLERRYDLSNESFRAWIADQAKSLGVGLLLGAGAAELVYATMRAWPSAWWLAGGVVFTALIVVLTNLAPVLLLPLFYPVKPLDRDALRARLLALAERADARVLGAYEWGLGGKTKKANAALAGLGSTRRILVSDTMLAEYSDDEIEVVLAHELAHHVHGDIWKGIAFESALVIAGFGAASFVLRIAAGHAGLRGPDDVAGLPLLLLTAGGVSLVTVPLAHAMSRRFERSADRFALDLTRNPGAFISAMRRLGAQNLAEEQPSRLVQWLFYSHPPMRDRIAAAQAFAEPGP